MKTKKDATIETTTTKPSTLTHVAITAGFASKKAMSTTKAASLSDLHLHKFLTIESEAAVEKNRTSLLVAFADGINWPFRTKEVKIEGVNTTIIQVSSGWIKQHVDNLDSILASFRAFCLNGHLVTPTIQAAFDSTFRRPSFTYTCECGWHHTQSYRLVKELDDKDCPACGKSARTMSVTAN